MCVKSSVSWIEAPVKSVLKRSTTKKYSRCKAICKRNVRDDATVYSDEMKSYLDLTQSHEAVQHSTGEFVHDDVQHRWRIPIALSRTGHILTRDYAVVISDGQGISWMRYVKESFEASHA